MGMSLDWFALAAISIYVGVGWVIGVRLLRLAKRTRGFPEAALGAGECLLAGLVPPLFIVAQAASEPAVIRTSHAFAQLAYTFGSGVLLLFTWRVFRPGEAWARVAVYAALLVLGIGGGLNLSRAVTVEDATELRAIQTLAFLVMEWISLLGFCWTMAEALHHHRRLRKQAALGLTDPAVANRMLLWAVVGAGGVVAAGAPVLAGLSGLDPATHVPTRLASGLAALVSSIAIQLAFLPPAAYLRWVRAGVARGAAVR
jgi:hypothetical protein